MFFLTELEMPSVGSLPTYLVIVACIVWALRQLSGILSAIKVIRKDGWDEFKKHILVPLGSRRRKMDQILHSQQEMKHDLGERLGRVEKELTTNHGTSTKDLLIRTAEDVNSVAGAVQKIQARIDHQDERSEQPIFHLTPTGEMCYTNCAFRMLLDAEDKDLFKKNYFFRVSLVDRQVLDLEITDAITKKRPFDVTVKFQVPGSGQIAVRLEATPNVKTGGELLGYFGTAKAADNN